MKAGWLLALLASAAQAAPDPVSFVTCPTYRDTDAGRKSGCWLAQDLASGIAYDVSPAPSKPDWNHEVLVEGRVAANPGNPCGGVVLDPVRTAILPGPCTRHMLPAEGFAGRRFVLPPRNLRPISEKRDVAPGPYGARTFRLFFDFDRDFMIYQYDDYLFDQMIAWLRVAKPARIIVTGFAATAPIEVSGRKLAEDPAVARTRAEKIGEALTRMGIDRSRLTVRWRTDPQTVDDADADHLVEPSRRRVEVEARF